MTDKPNRIRVAVPVPVSRGFEYRWDGPEAAPLPGTRVRVPFGSREKIGIVIDAGPATDLAESALKPVTTVIDDEPLIAADLLEALYWAADYYHHPIGDVMAQALPGLLRRGRAVVPEPDRAWTLSPAGKDVDTDAVARRARRQGEALGILRDSGTLTESQLRSAGVARAVIKRLDANGWIVPAAATTATRADSETSGRGSERPPELSSAQRSAVTRLLANREFGVALLYGVTGSGKTEVFLRLIADALARRCQCLLLVPEIGLTPQLVRRLTHRFDCRLAVFHSGLTDTERLSAWRDVRSGRARLIVGTRSAAFAPFESAGLIVVDEEHDTSYKQQSGFRYSGRDLAIMRGRALNIPVVLASATPSLESYRNAHEGRYQLLELPERIGQATMPEVRIIDLNLHAADQGLSTPLVSAMQHHLAAGGQVLLFINRRGFAPALFCTRCQKAAECRRCDSRMTIHANAGLLRCHHCGRSEKVRWVCPDCGQERIGVGAGTERVKSALESLFPDFPVARLDRDTAGNQRLLEDVLNDIDAGDARIIVGTQLLTKGHDFPDVTLVGVLNADQGLFGADFRSEERLAQTIIQVAGRAGRRERRGEVLIQTLHPGHPLLQHMLAGDYAGFVEHAISERAETGWPPFSHLAVFRAEAGQRERVFAFLGRLAGYLRQETSGVRILGPAPDRMERRDNRFRGQLLLQSERRSLLHAALRPCLQTLTDWPESGRVRWSVDVDPVEV
jgi:primosomal protein N' (replication factor Y)